MRGCTTVTLFINFSENETPFIHKIFSKINIVLLICCKLTYMGDKNG